MKASVALTRFNAGLVSPLLGARPDLELWPASLSRCVNMIPRVQGALQRAAGSLHVGSVRDSAERVWLVPFVFAQGDAFVLEFGPGYVRFLRGRGRLTTGPLETWDAERTYGPGEAVLHEGVRYTASAASLDSPPPEAGLWHALDGDIYEIATPWTAQDLTLADGAFGLRYEQSGDVLFLAGAGRAPMTLSRLSNVRWALAPFEALGGPFRDQNIDEAATVSASGAMEVGGLVTLTASRPIFRPGHAGGLMELELEDGADVKAWQVRTRTDVDDVRRADFRVYRCTQVGPVNTTEKPAICGEELPVHTRGRYWDGTGEEQKGDGAVGSIGVEWEYLHSGYGWVRITEVADATSATAVVLSRLPEELAGAPTHRWAFGAWSDAEGWPDQVCFFRERLTFCLGQQVWHSAPGDFTDFAARRFAEVLDDCAIVLSIQSAQGNAIQWATPAGSRLFLGAHGGEHGLSSQASDRPYAPGNAQQDPLSAWGGTGVRPVVVGSAVVFVEKLGRRLRLLGEASGGLAALDLNRHRGLIPPVIAMAWQQTPHESIWCVGADGSLNALTLQIEDQIAAWRTHDLGGAVEAVATIPSPDGRRDDVWLIVRRLIDGSWRRDIEYLAAEYEAGDDPALGVYANAALTRDGAPAALIGGLEHLEGETVSVLADGAAHPDRIVSGGQIALAAPAQKVVVGLPAPFSMRTQPLEGGAASGSAQGRPKRVHAATLRLLDSLGGAIGPEPGRCDPLPLRRPGAAMDAAPALFSGDVTMAFPGGHDGAAAITVEGEGVFPFTLLGLFADLVTYGE